MAYESLTDEKTKIIFEKVLPTFEGWTPYEIYDAMDYIKSIVFSSGNVKLPSNQNDIKSKSFGHIRNPTKAFRGY
jgi:hypothetical protein